MKRISKAKRRHLRKLVAWAFAAERRRAGVVELYPAISEMEPGAMALDLARAIERDLALTPPR